MQRYVVQKKSEVEGVPGETLLDKEFTTLTEITPEVQKVYAAGYKPEDIECRIVTETDTRTTPTPELSKSRKPRADKGLPHAKPEKKFRGRRKAEFFVFATGAIAGPYNRVGLAEFLDGLEPEVRNTARVFPGPELHFERRIQLTLKSAK